jgi:2'-5' RNA ligase
MPRIFIAVPVSDTVRAAIAALPHPPDTPLRWVSEGQLHVTLRFLGQISKHETDEALEATRAAAAGAGALQLDARGVGAFPHPERARVVWVGVSGQVSRLQALQGSLEEQLAARGFAREERPFTPHITVARSGKPGPLPTELRARAEHEFGSWQVETVQLIESQPGPAGSRYIVRQEFRLGSPSAA